MQWLTRAAPGAVNIGPAGQRRRRTWGVAALSVGVTYGIVAVVVAPPLAWRAMVFVPLWIGLLGVLQAREKT